MSYLKWIRQHVGPQKILLVYTSACVVDEHGHILWQYRADFNCWGLPGGVLELHESLPACAVREVEEETGLQVRPTHVVGVYSSPDFDVTYPNGDQVQQVTFCFACRIVGGALQADGRESRALRWFPAAYCPPTLPWYRAMLADLLAQQPSATFDQGTPGRGRATTPYYHFLRPYIGPARVTLPAVAAFVQNEAGHILLQQRGDNGQWCFPGGYVELGERVDQAIVQEVLEETGLHVQPMRVIGVYSDAVDAVTYANGHQVKLARTFFACHIRGGQLQADGQESLAVRFFAAEALPTLVPQHRRLVHDALADGGKTAF